MADGLTALVDPTAPAAPVVVSVFLRGGADGLHLAPPVGDPDYRRARPTLAVSKDMALPLDGVFALHPDLSPLHPLYASGELAVIHQIGTEDDSRSHFEAEDFLHYGGRTGGGWLGRFLRMSRSSRSGPLTAVTYGTTVSDSLHGCPAISFTSLDDFKLPGDSKLWRDELASLYRGSSGPLQQPGGDALEAVGRIEKIALQERQESATRKVDEFSSGLSLLGRLIRADLGLRAATIELGGWDSHFGQVALLTGLMRSLSEGLVNFHQQMGGAMKNVIVVVMTEFGRRVGENASLGTDHGRASVGLVLGGGVKGARVHHAWQGLDISLLEQPGDVPVHFNFRQLLASVMRKADGTIDPQKVFPGDAIQPLDLF